MKTITMKTNQSIAWTKKYGRFGVLSLIGMSIIYLWSSLRGQSNETNDKILAIVGCSTLIYLYFYSATIKHVFGNKQLSKEEFQFIFNPFVKLSGYLSFVIAALFLAVSLYIFYQAFIFLNSGNTTGFYLMIFIALLFFTIGISIFKYVHSTFSILKTNLERQGTE